MEGLQKVREGSLGPEMDVDAEHRTGGPENREH